MSPSDDEVNDDYHQRELDLESRGKFPIPAPTQYFAKGFLKPILVILHSFRSKHNTDVNPISVTKNPSILK